MEKSSSDLATRLRQAGVPQPAIDYALGSRIGRGVYLVGSIAAVAAFAAGIIGVFHLTEGLADWNRQIALAAASANDGILFHVNFGISSLIFVFAAIFGLGSLIGLAPLASDRLLRTTFVHSVVDTGGRAPTRKLLQWCLRRAAGETDPRRYVRRVTTGWAWPVAIVGLALAAVGVVVGAFELHSFSVFTPTAYLPSPLLPWASREPRPWSTAVSVATGCNHVVTKNAVSDTMIYEVTFADGTTVDIGRATPVEGRWIDAAEAVDRAVTAAGAAFVPWTWLSRDSYSPACIEAVWRRMPPREFERIARMLRFPL